MGVFGSILLKIAPLSAETLQQWQFNPRVDRLTIILLREGRPFVDRPIIPKPSILNNPSRLVLDFPNTQLAPTLPLQTPITDSTIKAIRVSQFQPDITRMVIELTLNQSLREDQVSIEVQGNQVFVQFYFTQSALSLPSAILIFPPDLPLPPVSQQGITIPPPPPH